MSDLTAGQVVMPYLYRGSPKLIELNDRIMAARYASGRTPAPERVRAGQIPGHGTTARAQWDRRRGNKPCAACREAEALAHELSIERRSQKPNTPGLQTGGAAAG